MHVIIKYSQKLFLCVIFRCNYYARNYRQGSETATRRCFSKQVFLKKLRKIQRKAPVLKSLFNKVTGLQETPKKVFPCEYCKISRNTFLIKHFQTTPFERFQISISKAQQSFIQLVTEAKNTSRTTKNETSLRNDVLYVLAWVACLRE